MTVSVRVIMLKAHSITICLSLPLDLVKDMNLFTYEQFVNVDWTLLLRQELTLDMPR